MPSTSWKYIENTFEANTRERRGLMNQIVLDHDAKLGAAAAATGADPKIVALNTEWQPEKAAWTKAYGGAANTRASYRGSTQSVENLLETLKHKPAPDQESKIENWDRRIRNVTPQGSPLYTTLLPEGRKPFSSGPRDEIITQVQDLGTRLSAQTTYPDLVTLGGEVTAFYGQLDTARKQQQGLEGSEDSDASTGVEQARKDIATALYGNLGMLMYIYQATPDRVASFFDLSLVRQPATVSKKKPAGGAEKSAASEAKSPGSDATPPPAK